MIITLSDYAYVGKREELNEEYSAESIKVGQEEYRIIYKSDVSIHISCEEKDKVKLGIIFSLKAVAPCDRCLEDVEFEVGVDSTEEYNILEETTVDTDDVLFKELVLDWPMKVLCSEDCKGLCIKCGLNLNKGQCECDTFIPDPRMAAIKDIFESER